MELLDWVLWLHVVAGALWIGGIMWQEANTAAARRMGGDEAYVTTFLSSQATNGRIYPVATIVVLGTAIWMILGRDYLAWDQLWINISFGIFIISFVTGIAYFSRTERQISEAFEAGGYSPEISQRVRTMHMVGRVETILLLALVWLMVFKPL